MSFWVLLGTEVSCVRLSLVESFMQECSVNKMSSGSELSLSVFSGLDSLRHDEILCDCVLKSVDGQKFPAHRVILAGCSEFFRGLFTHDEKSVRETLSNTLCDAGATFGSETSTDSKHTDGSTEEFGPGIIHLQVTSDLLRWFVEFAYSGEMRGIHFWDIERLLPLADKWIVPGMVDACCGILEEGLHLDNAIGIWRFAGAYGCEDLERKSKRFILYHIWEMLIEGESTEAFTLSGEELVTLLDDDWVNVPQENGIFLLIRKWIKTKEKKRILSLPRLLSTMRLGLCSTDFIEEILILDPYCQASPDALDIVRKARQELSIQTLDLKLTHRLLRPRIPQDILFTVGGWADRSPTSCIETYDRKSDEWFLCSGTDASPRAYHGLAVVHQKIYVVGGFDGTEYYNSVRCLDAEEMRWSEGAPMYLARCYVSVTVLDGLIYAIGGFDGRARLTSAERYNPRTNQWSLINSMNRERSDASAATFKGKIYVAGGFNGQEVLRSVEVYCPREDIWFMVAETLSPRSGVSLVADENSLFVIGGFSGHSRLTSGEKYDADTMSWTKIRDMRTARSNFAAAILDGKIYVIGGFNGHRTTGEVECYDPRRDEWEEVRGMTVNRSAVKACVLSTLSEPQRFSFHGHHHSQPHPYS